MHHQFNEELKEFMVLGQSLGLVGSQFGSDQGSDGKFLSDRGVPILDCTRMDYLGLGENRQIKSMMQTAIAHNDIGCPASQIVTKPYLIDDLEQKTALWQGLNQAWIFTSGYSVNVNIIQALGMRFRSPHLRAFMKSNGIGRRAKDSKTLFFFDKYSHYSLMHGMRICRSLYPDHVSTHKFDCENMATLRAALEKHKTNLKTGLGVIVSDTLVSGNGNVVDVAKLYEIAEEYNCLLYLDEAHAVGAMGEDGRGVAANLLDRTDIDKDRLIIMGTFTKAFCQLGGFVALGNTDLAHMLRIASPQFMFSSPVLPWMAHVISETIDLFCSSWGTRKRSSLQSKAEYLRRKLEALGFDTLGSTTHVVPMLVGDEQRCFAIQETLRRFGYHIAAFHYPARPRGQAILRFSVCDDMTYAELKDFVHVVAQCIETTPLQNASIG